MVTVALLTFPPGNRTIPLDSTEPSIHHPVLFYHKNLFCPEGTDRDFECARWTPLVIKVNSILHLRYGERSRECSKIKSGSCWCIPSSSQQSEDVFRTRTEIYLIIVSVSSRHGCGPYSSSTSCTGSQRFYQEQHVHNKYQL